MEIGMDSTNIMLKDRGLKEIESLEEYRELFSFPIKEYYRDLGFDFEKEPYEVLAPIWVDIYNEKSRDVTLIEGAREALERARGLGVTQVVFSATERNMLIRQLGELDVLDCFDEIIGLDNIHAESKLHLAKKWRETHPDAKILYVGDTVHDAENAKMLQADCLLFTGGHQSRRRLEACGYSMIDSIEDIFDFI